MHSRWRNTRPPDHAWRVPKTWSRAERIAEQDAAAGGSQAREIQLGEGHTAHASIALRVNPRGRRIYAYLRWSVGGKTHERYVGEVDCDDRFSNLKAAWQAAHRNNLLNSRQTAESWASSKTSQAVMRGNRSRDTRPELALRSALHALGLRYRVNFRPVKQIRRTADLVFTKAKVAVFLDGCFWHGCPDHYRPAKGKNAQFWKEKIESNQLRDKDTDQKLADAGWESIRVWEHEQPEEAARRIAKRVSVRLDIMKRH